MNDPRPPVVSEAAARADAAAAARVAATIRDDVRALRAYPVAKTEGLIALNANENPFSLPAALASMLGAALAAVPVHRYPDGAADRVKAALAAALPIPSGAGVVVGNGSDELIQIITSAVARPGANVLAPEPTFVMYAAYAMQAHARYVGVPLREDFSLDQAAMVSAIEREHPVLIWLASPNNPTGQRIPRETLERILAVAPGVVVVDEAYADFGDESLLRRALDFPNLIVLRTLSKIGLAGLRLGYAVAHPAWTRELDKVRSPYNVNALTQAAVEVVLGAADVLAAQVAAIRAERGRLGAALGARAGIRVFPSDANFLLVRVPDAVGWSNALRRAGILVKNLDGTHPLLRHCLRITVGTPAENDALLAALPS